MRGKNAMTDRSKKLIRNSTAEFLVFTGQSGEQSIEARYEDETIWLTQKLMAQLFDVKVPTINEHLKNIFDSGELEREATIRKSPKIKKKNWGQADNVQWKELIGKEIEEFEGTMASDVGYVPSDGGNYLKFLLIIRGIVERYDSITERLNVMIQ
jgi:hypothetical protein